MPNKVQHYRSETAGAKPGAAQLAVGELAINSSDFRAFTKTSAGVVVEIAPWDRILSLANTWANEQTFKSVTETVYDLTGTAIDAANGTIQHKTLTGAVTFTSALTTGQSVLLRIEGGDANVITWPAATWVGGAAPTLGANAAVVLWQEGATLYGVHIGDFS